MNLSNRLGLTVVLGFLFLHATAQFQLSALTKGPIQNSFARSPNGHAMRIVAVVSTRNFPHRPLRQGTTWHRERRYFVKKKGSIRLRNASRHNRYVRVDNPLPYQGWGY